MFIVAGGGGVGCKTFSSLSPPLARWTHCVCSSRSGPRYLQNLFEAQFYLVTFLHLYVPHAIGHLRMWLWVIGAGKGAFGSVQVSTAVRDSWKEVEDDQECKSRQTFPFCFVHESKLLKSPPEFYFISLFRNGSTLRFSPLSLEFLPIGTGQRGNFLYYCQTNTIKLSL